MKTIYLSIVVGLFSISIAHAGSDAYTLKTVVPTSSNIVADQEFVGQTEKSGSCKEGKTYYNKDKDRLEVCINNVWVPLSAGTWIKTGSDNVHLVENDDKVGIGTSAPTYKLHVKDGGILASGTSATVPPTGSVVELLWHPGKKAFRVGEVDDNDWVWTQTSVYHAWDNDWIGKWSTAIGYNTVAFLEGTTVSGGAFNIALGKYSNVAGGYNNWAGNAFDTTLGHSSVLGGKDNKVESKLSAIAGGETNTIKSNYSFVGGGQGNTIGSAPEVGRWSVIGGGEGNTINLPHSVIGGGKSNSTFAVYSTIGGGNLNDITGGLNHINDTIAGGSGNSVLYSASSTIGGGEDNKIEIDDTTGNRFTDFYNTIAGGYTNQIDDAVAATITGGRDNTAKGDFSTVIGGRDNDTDGDYSVVGGRNMNLSAAADNTFMWGNSTTPITAVTTANAFIIYPGTNVGIGTTAPAAALHISDVMKLEPRTSPPACTATDIGTIYLDDSGALCVCTAASTWSSIGTGSCT